MTRIKAGMLVFFLFFPALLAIGRDQDREEAGKEGESSMVFFLCEDWRLASSQDVKAGGEEISLPGFDDSGWYQTDVPKTVLAALVERGVYPDPYFGTNLKRIPGFVEGRWLRMPEDSPFYPPWWYRTEFKIPETFQGKHLKLHLDGINYKANVFLNGKKIADQEEVTGMFRRFEFDITGLARPGELNGLAVEVIAPGKLPKKKYHTKQVEATTGWDDHNPYPPDMNLGIWRPVYISATGPVDLKHPYVLADLEVPSLERASLTVSAFLENLTDKEQEATVTAVIEDIRAEKTFALPPRAVKEVKLTPGEFKQLVIEHPRVWWPHPVGPQELYKLEISVSAGGALSDREETTFGIRKAETFINDEGWRTYMINGRKILIRGGAWMTSDMMLNLTSKRYEALVRYAREANLNMLRSEGFSIRETDEFYDLCDRLGVMVTQQIFGRSIPDEKLAIACVEDMMLRIRNHPSLVHFLGHDETYPTPTLDRAYRELIKKYELNRTYQPHSGAFNVRNRWKTGGTRTGTLELWTHAGPAHYYLHKRDGAWGFAQSGGIGGVCASLESIKRMLPEDELWPPLHTESWSFHTVIQGGTYFNKMIKKMNRRYGETNNIEDFVLTAQVQNYESARGMFEAYARNKYSATGITTWKYDAAWPAAITWQYIDWFLLPTGAYYGAKKACEPLHVQFSYDDGSIWVVNSFYREFSGLLVKAALYDFNMRERWKTEKTVEVGPDGKTEVFKVTPPEGLTRSYFLYLELRDSEGRKITDNFYWLSTRPERPGHKLYGMVPISPSSYFDHTMLRELPKTGLALSWESGEDQGEKVIKVLVKNPGDTLAFFIQLAVLKGRDGFEVAPSYWSENDFSLLPGQVKTLEVRFAAQDLEGEDPVLRVGGWNIKPAHYEL